MKSLHFMTQLFAAKDDENKDNKKDNIEYNADGTMAVDVLRTGTWSHGWYGLVEFTKADLETMIENFTGGIIGYVLTFNYHHERRENFGKVVRMRIEERVSKFNNDITYVLVADVALTDKGREDVESAQVHNFSAEVDNDYVHREVILVPLLDTEGVPVVDDDGKERRTFIRRKYGPTLIGGAVTNYPFITDLNPNGLGGNRNVVAKDEQGFANSDCSMMAFGDKPDEVMIFSCIDKFELCDRVDQVYVGTQPPAHSNEHTAQIRETSYDEYHCQNDKFSDGVHAHFGLVGSASGQKTELLAIRFDDSKFTADEARAWLNDNNFKYIKFEVATGAVEPSGDKKTVTDIEEMDILHLDNKLISSFIKDGNQLVQKDNRIFVGDADAIAAVKALTSDEDVAKYFDCVATHRHGDTDINIYSRNETVIEDQHLSEESGQLPKNETLPETPAATTPTEGVALNMAQFEERFTQLETKFTAELTATKTAYEERLQAFTADNEALKIDLEASKDRAFKAEVDSTIADAAFTAATPAFKSVMRRSLTGNRNLSIRYLDPETNEFSDISLSDLFAKIVETVDFDSDEAPDVQDGGGTTELTNPDPITTPDTPVVLNLKKDGPLTAAEIAAATQDDAHFSELIRDLQPRRIPGYSFKKKSSASAPSGN